jgi:hypothetical protein
VEDSPILKIRGVAFLATLPLSLASQILQSVLAHESVLVGGVLGLT